MKKFLVLLIVCVISLNKVFAYYELEDNEILYEEEIKEVMNNIQKKPIIYAKSAILYDKKYKRVLFEKNSSEQVPNASTTKILTAIVAYENGNVDDMVTVSKNAANTGGSKVKFKENDKITLNDLLYGLLLRSGNDAAVAIAEYIGGDTETFCHMLNEKAKELGAMNTNFTSPHGLDEDNHYSTAYDLAIMADYALSIPYIANIVKCKTALIRINGIERGIANTNEMLSYYNGADGVKTGYTGDAGRCLVTSATRDGRQLISVVLGCNTKKQRTTESIKLLDYGFQSFEIIDLAENMKKDFLLEVYKSKGNVYKISIEASYPYPLLPEEIEKVEYVYNFNSDLEAPLRAGEKCGKITIKIDNEVIKEFDINTKSEIKRKTIEDYINILIKRMSKIEVWENCREKDYNVHKFQIINKILIISILGWYFVDFIVS